MHDTLVNETSERSRAWAGESAGTSSSQSGYAMSNIEMSGTGESEAASGPQTAARTQTVLDVVIPVYNEESVLEASVNTVHAYLSEHVPYRFRITIADNASADSTLQVARALAAQRTSVRAVALLQKGRGGALKAVWSHSDALILACMDVDLSTDLSGLYPLVASLMSGHSDVAIGSRLANGSHVIRGRKRDVISRTYNHLLRSGLGVKFTDAQCGFKAIRADVARELLPLVEDTAWFFDTELLVLAVRAGLRIHEVPVDWYDDPDSRVDVVATARDDLRGMWRMRVQKSQRRDSLARIREQMERGTVLPV